VDGSKKWVEIDGNGAPRRTSSLSPHSVLAWDLQLSRHLSISEMTHILMWKCQIIKALIGNVQLALLLVLASTSALDEGSTVDVQINTV
jgi:hypothetical protein